MSQPDIFNKDIAGKIAAKLGPLVFDLTLKKEGSTRNPADSTEVTESETDHTVKGFVDTYKDWQIRDSLVERGDRKIVILGGSLPDGVEPEVGDHIVAEAHTWEIVAPVERDPAGATYSCQCRQ